MRITKKINNNAAVGVDSQGREVVVIGRGIGFPDVPYQLDDLSRVERTYYGVDSQYFGLLSEISPEAFAVSSRIVEHAKLQIDAELNPNLAFTLADHIHFAIWRLRRALPVGLPQSYDLEIEHPEDFEVARYGLELIRSMTSVELPEDEVTSLALHIINAHAGKTSSGGTRVKDITNAITDIIESGFGMAVDRKSYDYYRFASHIRRFVTRRAHDIESADGQGSLYKYMVIDHPRVHQCVERIDAYIELTLGARCSQDEFVYLMIHVKALTDD